MVILKENNDYLQNYSVYNDEIEPLESGNGNPLPAIIFSFLGAAVFLLFGFLLLLSDIAVKPEIFGSQIASKIFVFLIMFVISLFFLFYSIGLFKRLKIYNRQKRELENYPLDEIIKDKLEQRTCPKCGHVHDIDYPKCPKCGFSFL